MAENQDRKNKRLEEIKNKLLDLKIERMSEYDVHDFYTRQKKLLTDETRKKKKRVTLRICEEDLMALKEKAQDERLPYQTLITRLIAKYLKGEIEMKGI